MHEKNTKRGGRFASVAFAVLRAVLLLALDRADAAIVNVDVPARHWLHSPAESLVVVAVNTASSNSGVVGVARVKSHTGFM